MKKRNNIYIRYILLLAGLSIVLLTQFIPAWGRVYALYIYPFISRVLAPISGIFPFSLGDVFILLSILGILAFPFMARKRKIRWSKIILRIIEHLAWVYIWFYLAWGLNYFQPNFYQRTGVPYTAYTEENFREFLKEYVNELNKSYVPVTDIDKTIIHQQIINQYRELNQGMGIHTPKVSPKVKTMLFSSLFSKMAITGYMGPFFCEFNVNNELPPSQYAFTYAHELSHFLGISSEAEANFYAYQTCIRTENPTITFCGYFSVLNHVLGNARRLMDSEEYKQLFESINPDIITLAQENQMYWRNKYSPVIGDIQDWIYNLYLKGNQIPSGTQNYSEVIGLLISWREAHNNQEPNN